jgi:hypothetical protein
MKQIGSVEKIRKFNAKFDNSFVLHIAEMLAVSSRFHGQLATCGGWQQCCPPWLYSVDHEETNTSYTNLNTYSLQVYDVTVVFLRQKQPYLVRLQTYFCFPMPFHLISGMRDWVFRLVEFVLEFHKASSRV